MNGSLLQGVLHLILEDFCPGIRDGLVTAIPVKNVPQEFDPVVEMCDSCLFGVKL